MRGRGGADPLEGRHGDERQLARALDDGGGEARERLLDRALREGRERVDCLGGPAVRLRDGAGRDLVVAQLGDGCREVGLGLGRLLVRDVALDPGASSDAAAASDSASRRR